MLFPRFYLFFLQLKLIGEIVAVLPISGRLIGDFLLFYWLAWLIGKILALSEEIAIIVSGHYATRLVTYFSSYLEWLA